MLESRRAMMATKAARTWFCTFTWTPAQHSAAGLQAASLAALANEDFFVPAATFQPRMESEQRLLAWQYIWRVRALNKELTEFFKRLRKNSKSKLTYFLVWEPHTGKRSRLRPDVEKGTDPRNVRGLPHAHALIHEIGGKPLLHAHFMGRSGKLDRWETSARGKPKAVWKVRPIVAAWRGGFTTITLARPEDVFYVTKYVGKDLGALTKVRNSRFYGLTEEQKLQRRRKLEAAKARKSKDALEHRNQRQRKGQGEPLRGAPE